MLLLPIMTNGDVVTLKNGNKIYGLVQKFNKEEGIILEVDTGLVTVPSDSIFQYDISKQPKINYEYKEYKYPNQRSKEDINTVVMKNLDKLKKLHLNFLKKKIIIEGKITVRFSVDGLGNVIDAQIVESDISIFNFNEAVLDIVRNYATSYQP